MGKIKSTKLRDCELNPLQIRILQAILDNPQGLTRGELQKVTQIKVPLAATLGPTDSREFEEYERGYGIKSLHQLNLVEVEQREERTGVKDIWILTKSGEEAAKTYQVKRHRTKREKIPESILAPILKEFRKTRAYGFENYTEEDIREILSVIKETREVDFSYIPIPDVKNQIENVRKRGLLREEKKEEFPQWYTEYRDGDYWQEVEETTYAENPNGKACFLNPEHTEGLQVRHIRYDSLGEEQTGRDVIVICDSCRKKLGKNFPPIPPELP